MREVALGVTYTSHRIRHQLKVVVDNQVLTAGWVAPIDKEASIMLEDLPKEHRYSRESPSLPNPKLTNLASLSLTAHGHKVKNLRTTWVA